MWVMEETGYPSSDPPQMGHLQQKVHAQQSPACSLERTSMSLRTTGTLLSSLGVCEKGDSYSYVCTYSTCLVLRGP